MRATSILLAVLLLVALGVPAAAVAQSAGDDQYTDPFGPDENRGSGQGGGGQGGGGGGGDQGSSGTTTPPADTDAGTAPAPSVGTDASGSAGASASDGGPTLPNTGLPAGLIAALGGGLLAGGAALRRRA